LSGQGLLTVFGLFFLEARYWVKRNGEHGG
jgi:hypothetical protein